MRSRFLGDSYDIVKQSLLRWLSPLGHWSVLPMYTEAASPNDVEALEHLLGASAVSQEVLGADTGRVAYFELARKCDAHLFLDPDTGLSLGRPPKRKAPCYLFADELVGIAQARPRLLTLVFDQSVSRGRERQQLDAKLSALAGRGLHGFAYVSHACFLLVGSDGILVKRASEIVREDSRLPGNRFLEWPAVEHGT